MTSEAVWMPLKCCGELTPWPLGASSAAGGQQTDTCAPSSCPEGDVRGCSSGKSSGTCWWRQGASRGLAAPPKKLFYQPVAKQNKKANVFLGYKVT